MKAGARLPRRPRPCCSACSPLYFFLPLLSMLDFSIQGKGAARGRASRSTTTPSWSATRTCAARSSPRCCWPCFTVVLMVVLLVPTMIWVRLRVPGLTRTRGVPLPAAADRPAAGDRGRHHQRLRVGQLPARRLPAGARLRLRRAGAALLLPVDRLGAVGHRRDHARRGRPLAGRRLDHRDHPDRAAQHRQRRARRGLHRGRPGARGVRLRLAAALRHDAGRARRHLQVRDLDGHRGRASPRSCSSRCCSLGLSFFNRNQALDSEDRRNDHHPGPIRGRARRRAHRPDPRLRLGARARRPHPAPRAGRAGRPARPVRLRQDHGAAHPRRPRPAHVRHASRSAARTSPGCRPTSATWGWSSRPTACSRT